MSHISFISLCSFHSLRGDCNKFIHEEICTIISGNHWKYGGEIKQLRGRDNEECR